MIEEVLLALKPTVSEVHVRGILVILLLVIIVVLRRRRKFKLPPGPMGLPVVGYLPFLGKDTYRSFDQLSKKYGKVFGLYLGREFVVVLGDYSTVKEAFSKATTIDRPPKLFDFLPDSAGVSSLNGEDWVEQRRYTIRTMRDIGLGRTRWEELVQEEVDDFVSHVAMYEGKPIDLSQELISSVANNVTSLVFGKRIPRENPARQKVDRCIQAMARVANQASFRNFIPSLYNLLIKLGVGEYAKDHYDIVAFNDYIKKEIVERKIDMKESNDDSGIFIDEYLKEISHISHRSFSERNLRGNTTTLLVAGTDTVTSSLTWLFLAMVTYPDIQKKVHQELDAVLGNEGRAQWSGRGQLPYTYAVIIEGQRWMTVVPLNLTRIAMEDITLGGYDIPKGTPIIGNFWALHRDSNYWSDPEVFIPERFLSKDGKQTIYKHDSYVPFSFGRRNCPGETVAMIEILFYFTAVIQRFQVQSPAGQKPKLEGIPGIVHHAVPQKLRFVPRN